jgi:excisionase family DNA binding protein
MNVTKDPSPAAACVEPLTLTLTPTEAAKLVGISRASLYRWIARGVFPAPSIKVGRTVRWSRATVQQWADSRVGA